MKKPKELLAIQYLIEHGSITNLEALNLFNYWSLGTAVKRFRVKHGDDSIISEPEGNHVRYKINEKNS